jgi:hypothetical protein
MIKVTGAGSLSEAI